MLSDLARTIQACHIPRAPFDALIEANRQDQFVHSYASYADLVGYCELSANPVGHLVLYVFVLAPSINALGHWRGRRTFRDNSATNLRVLAWLTGGESLHNNHHGYPRSPKFSFRSTEIDPAWPVIKLLISLKLAKPYKTIEEVAA